MIVLDLELFLSANDAPHPPYTKNFPAAIQNAPYVSSFSRRAQTTAAAKDLTRVILILSIQWACLL